ncbi:MAG TPA: ribokinase [Burkholderiaceae bacterium]|nr:ribokinase [Burkholderiaceae bacterium]
MTAASIAVFGSVNVDVTAFCARLPRPGETIHGRGYSMTLGGKGANQAVAAARLGAHASLIGRTGTDAFGALVRERLGTYGVNLDRLHAQQGAATGVAVINVDSRAENTIVVIGGANMLVDATDVERALPTLAAAQVLLLQLEVPLEAALAAAARTRAAGGKIMLDPAPAPAAGLSASVYAAVDMLTPNETETEALVGLRPQTPADAAIAAARLREQGVRTAIIKMGAAGVFFDGPEGSGYVPPFSVAAVNSVGAGDCFNGGLAFALAQGRVLPEAVRFGAACGALATTGPGGAASAPALADVEDLLRAVG